MHPGISPLASRSHTPPHSHFICRFAVPGFADDFDLPTTDFDSDTDEARAVPKRNDEEKWGELCLDEFLHPTRRGSGTSRSA